MCIFLIKHWAPCLHMRGRCVEQCATNLATPDITANDCAGRRDVFLDEAEEGGCPVCQRKEAFGLHVRSGGVVAGAGDGFGANAMATWRTAMTGSSATVTTTHNSMCPRGRTIGGAISGSEADILTAGNVDGELENPFADPPENPFLDPVEDPFADPEDPFADPVEDPFAEPPENPFADPEEDPFADPPENPFLDPVEDPFADPPDNPFLDPPENPFLDPDDDSTVVPSIHEGSGENTEN
ncbi:hypothetical protein B0A55_08584 [Friedmanniomyces simplex]|uniref:Uncharacterized protein n=1 Tax=Friedmanniomyces simplex TaxID=329884 RepID=A0A4U0X8V6_9PEZI|nr:hypothetical protein B0A55_08584 [Friedmanniomyces simplex]